MNRDLYDVARSVCFEFGMPWTDPRTLKTHCPPRPPRKKRAKKKARKRR